jgi:hypothetical protein
MHKRILFAKALGGVTSFASLADGIDVLALQSGTSRLHRNVTP